VTGIVVKSTPQGVRKISSITKKAVNQGLGLNLQFPHSQLAGKMVSLLQPILANK